MTSTALNTSSTPASWWLLGTRQGSTPAATLPSLPRFIHAMSLMTQFRRSAAATSATVMSRMPRVGMFWG